MGSKKKRNKHQQNDKNPRIISNSESGGDNTCGENSGQPLEEIPKTGFKILPIEIESISNQNDNLSANPSSSIKHHPLVSIHYCYFKSHDPRINSRDNSTILPAERTLFITNLPVDTTEHHIKHIFEEYGIIDRILFHGVLKNNEFLASMINTDNDDGSILMENKIQGKKSKKKKKQKFNETVENSVLEGSRNLLIPGSTAHIVFKDSEGLTNALNMVQKKRIWNIRDQDIPPLGLKRWLQEYQKLRTDPNKLGAQVDEYMRKFEEAEQEKHKALEARRNQPDEDGFILVTGTGKRNINTDGTITVTAVKADVVKNLKPKNKELVDFYRFQMREAKRGKLAELRKKFEDDKRKIADLKAARRFKPY
ncbi:ribosomal RNA-processing protein 7-domain-containing protein [Gigaspora margarita]|uniref:Ribosomal RNA-processing protein 7-domain-containing protein n=1 Tax=Gigaspora margarita TaxID=4874 RepID=A0A8H4ABQ3_GIGMA|nr:ribosomal RNA-processing protein 7-domain-containing protein [Gigaspora margarita]